LGQANLGVLERADMVNVVVHGHEPSLSEMIVTASQDPEIIAYAQAPGQAASTWRASAARPTNR
jgi:anaerobic carbon-monoxide dehydrogenase catalytic subunit